MGVDLAGQIPEGGQVRPKLVGGLLDGVIGIYADSHDHHAVGEDFDQDAGQFFASGEHIVGPMQAHGQPRHTGLDRAQHSQSGAQPD